MIWSGGFWLFWSSWPADFKNYLQCWLNEKLIFKVKNNIKKKETIIFLKQNKNMLVMTVRHKKTSHLMVLFLHFFWHLFQGLLLSWNFNKSLLLFLFGFFSCSDVNICLIYSIMSVLLNWDSLYAKLNSHYKAWSCKKKKH